MNHPLGLDAARRDEHGRTAGVIVHAPSGRERGVEIDEIGRASQVSTPDRVRGHIVASLSHATPDAPDGEVR